jgi:hypothetical protein
VTDKLDTKSTLQTAYDHRTWFEETVVKVIAVVGTAGLAALLRATGTFFHNPGFLPSGVVVRWQSPLIWTFSICQAVLASTQIYYLPFMSWRLWRLSTEGNVVVTRRHIRRIVLSWTLLALAAGMDHLLGLIGIWHPAWWLAAFTRILLTLGVLGTAISLSRTYRELTTQAVIHRILMEREQPRGP